VEVLGRSFEVDPHWLHRLVRVEVNLDGDKIPPIPRWLSR
jgi:hypothetical protein